MSAFAVSGLSRALSRAAPLPKVKPYARPLKPLSAQPRVQFSGKTAL